MASKGADEIIKEIGGCGRFQIVLGIVMHTIKLSTVWSMFTMVFAAATPKWWCYDDVNVDVMPVLNTTDFYLNVSNTNYSVNVEPLYKSCTNRTGGACKNIVYDYSMRTIFNEWELACSNEWIPPMIASIQMAGLFLGHFISGHLADRFGRKVPLMLSLILMLIFNIAALFAQSWIFLAVARAIVGCGMAFYLTIQYTLVAEVSLVQWRSLNVNSPSWAIQLSLFALLAYLVPNWRTLSLISGLSCVPFMVTWFFIPESFRWYLSHDKHAEAKKVIDRIARCNGKSPPRELTLESHLIKEDNSAKGDDKHYSVIDLFRHRALRNTTLISILNWFSLGVTAYGISFGLQALSGNFFLNLFMFNAIGILPKLSLSFFSNRFGRKRTSISIFTLIAVSSLAVGIVQYIDMDEELRVRLTFAFAMLCYICNGMSWGAVQTITLELYPTVVRNIGYGFLNMCARVGAILAPQFAFLDTQIFGFMYFFISSLATLCATGTAFLSETNRWELACSNEWIPPMIASIQMAGLFLGHFISGHLADRFGRKVPLMLSLILMLIFNIAAFFAQSWIFLAVARAIVGCGMAFYLTIQYTLVAEVSLVQWRSLNIYNPSWAIQLSLFALLAYLVPNWRTLSLISGLSCLPFIVTWFFIPESFRWYLSHDKHAEANKVIDRIARCNGKAPPRELTLESHLIKEDNSAKGDDEHYSVIDLFRHRVLRKTTLISILNWFSLGVTGYGISFGLQALSGSFFLNLFMFSAIVFLPKLSTSFFSNRFGRKRTSISIFTLIAVSSLDVGIVQYIDMDEELRGRLTFAFAMLCYTCNGMSWGAVQTITLELYPTVVRNIGYGFLKMCARVGAIIAPQFAFLDTQIVGFMYFFISGIATMCATGTAFLRETNRVDLVDNI